MKEQLIPTCGMAPSPPAKQNETTRTDIGRLMMRHFIGLPVWGAAVLSAASIFLIAQMFAGCKPSQEAPANSGSPGKNDQGNVVSRTPTNTVTTPAAEPTLPKEISISRAAFEARYGKPLFTKDEFDAVFKGLYNIGLDQFLAMLGTNYFGVLPERRDALAEALRIFGNKSDSFRESYTAIIPHEFVAEVRSNNTSATASVLPDDGTLDRNLRKLGLRTEGRENTKPVTKFEKLTGLSKSEYLASIKKLGLPNQSGAGTIELLAKLLEAGGVDVDRFGEAEPFEGFRWRDIDRCLMSIRPVPDRSSGSDGSGLLGQLWYVRRLMPSFDFAVYRGDGVDSLVFYDKDGVALCLQTLWGSQGGFIEQFISSHIDLASFVERIDYKRIEKWRANVNTRKLLVVDFRPVQGVWCPVLYGQLLFMPKGMPDGGLVQFEDKPMDLSGNPKAGQLLAHEYAGYFTNTFAFFNGSPPVVIQNNGLEGGPESKDSDERLAPQIVDWPVDAAHEEHDRGGNLLAAGKNYTGQLMLREYREGYCCERAQVFGRTSLILPLLTARTLEAQRAAAAEKAYWSRYIQQTTGSSGQMTPAELLEEVNRRQILRQLFQDK
jgi:hypothetical protein